MQKVSTNEPQTRSSAYLHACCRWQSELENQSHCYCYCCLLQTGHLVMMMMMVMMIMITMEKPFTISVVHKKKRLHDVKINNDIDIGYLNSYVG